MIREFFAVGKIIRPTQLMLHVPNTSFPYTFFFLNSFSPVRKHLAKFFFLLETVIELPYTGIMSSQTLILYSSYVYIYIFWLTLNYVYVFFLDGCNTEAVSNVLENVVQLRWNWIRGSFRGNTSKFYSL